MVVCWCVVVVAIVSVVMVVDVLWFRSDCRIRKYEKGRGLANVMYTRVIKPHPRTVPLYMPPISEEPCGLSFVGTICWIPCEKRIITHLET